MCQQKLWKNEKIKEVLLSTPFLAFAVFCFFPPDCIEVLVPPVDIVIDVCRLLLIIGAIIVYVLDGKVTNIIFAIAAYYVLLTFSTLINNGDLWEVASQASKALGISVFTEIYLRRNAKKFFNSIVILFSALCVVNLFTVILCRNGLYTSKDFYFLGNYNTHIYYILPLLTIIFLRWEGKLHFGIRVLLILACSVSFIICHSVSSMVTMSVFLILLTIREFMRKRGRKCFQRPVFFYAAYILGSLEIVVIRIHTSFSYIIQNVFHKNMTLTGRTPMWDKALAAFPQSPIFGFGSQSREYMIDLIGKRHCHNLLLQVLFQTGIIGLLAFAGILFFVARAVSKSSYERCQSLFVILLFCFLVMYLTELSGIGIFIWMLTIMFHIQEIGSALETEKGELAR